MSGNTFFSRSQTVILYQINKLGESFITQITQNVLGNHYI